MDDHPSLRLGLRSVLCEGERFDVVAECGSVSAALEALQNHQPAFAIVDISLQTGNGLDLVRRCRDVSPDTRILVFSMFDEAIYAERALRAGAMGYLNKAESSDRILEALDQLAEGKIYLSKQMTNAILTRVRQPSGERFDGISCLTDRELQMMLSVAQGLPTRKIADALKIAAKTVETHKSNIKKKLNLDSASALAKYAAQWTITQQ